MVTPKWAHASSICPPLGLAYLASSIQQAGYGVRTVDALGENPFQHIVLHNKNFLSIGLATPDIVELVGGCEILGVSLMFSHDWPVAKSILKAIRKTLPNVFIICGGEHITAVPEFCLEDCPEIDVCVVGEGEETIIELLDAIQDSADLSNIFGIAYRDNGRVILNGPRPRISKLEEIARPAWDLFPLENYLSNELGYGVNPGRTIPLLASRGCPFQCTFCSSPRMWTTHWQARHVDDVLDEMQSHIHKYRVTNFDFYDLTTIVRKDWIREFCRKLKEKEWDVTWQMPSGTRSEALDVESLTAMFNTNQKNITYAPESGSPKTLKIIKKKIKLDSMKSSMRSAVKTGMNVKLNMIMGFPHETTKEIGENFWFLLDAAVIGVHDVYIACFSPYPGSELFEELEKSGQIRDMDAKYFYDLMSYSDIRFSKSYSQSITDRQLTMYRLGGMAIFYFMQFVIRPWRLLTLLQNLIFGRERSRLDMSLRQMMRRLQRVHKSRLEVS
jgi:radical SAM superfamily enzyme YgiQ (UPF0313 family)